MDPLGIAGLLFGDYKIIRFRAPGGFAFVYEALHVPSNTMVALKVLKPNSTWQEKREFVNEGSLLLKMTGASQVVEIFGSAQHVVPVSGPGQFPATFDFHVLELAERSLDNILPNLGLLDWTSRLSIYRDVVLGMHQLHLRRIVHRDLKTANCLLFLNGNSVRAKINDLGRSRDLDQLAANQVIDYAYPRGDYNYAPPELLWGLGIDSPITHILADLYGLGGLLFEITLGQSISSIALLPHIYSIKPQSPIDPQLHLSMYKTRLAEIRSWFHGSFAAFDSVTPKCIRQQAGQLIRQLCDPNPTYRLPRIAPGRRGVRPGELCWLLNRVDSLRLALSNDLQEVHRQEQRKGA